MQNNVNSNISWYEGHTITSLGKILKFSKFYVQIIWQVVRWWHHQLTHFHIHIDWSRNVLWKFAKLQSVITSLFFNQFSSGFHCYVWNFLLFLLKFKLYLFRIYPLIKCLLLRYILHMYLYIYCSKRHHFHVMHTSYSSLLRSSYLLNLYIPRMYAQIIEQRKYKVIYPTKNNLATYFSACKFEEGARTHVAPWLNIANAWHMEQII